MELDQKGLTDGSLILILFSSKREISDSDKRYVLALYVRGVNLDKIRSLAGKRGIGLLYKKHPIDKSERSISVNKYLKN